MMPKKTQRVIVIIIAVILALVMIAGLVMPAFAAGESAPSDEAVPAEEAAPAEEALPAEEIADEEAADEAETGETASDEAVAANEIDLEEEAFDFAGDSNTDKILPGIHVGEIDVAGLTSAEAEERVTKYVVERQDKYLTVLANGQSRQIRVGDLGFVWANPEAMRQAQYLGKSGNIIERYKFYKDAAIGSYTIPMTYSVVEDAVWSFAAQTAEQVNVSVSEPSLRMNEEGAFEVTEGHSGASLDEEASVGLIMDLLINKWDGQDVSLELPMVTVEPSISNEAMYNVKDRLGSGQTDFRGSSENRVQNITNGVSKINGVILMPGEQFSLVDHFVPFSEENGYAAAPSYSSGEIVDSYGGGICQVSTTLYLALLEAELQIDERHNHSMLVGYIKPSMDAAIAEGNKDLKFTNNTDSPIYIHAVVNDTLIQVDIFGHQMHGEDHQVTYTSEVLNETPATDKISFDDSIKFGHIHQTDFGHLGTESRLIKTVTDGGVTTEEVMNEDTYQMSPICYTVGTRGCDASTVSSLMSAAGSEIIGDVISAIGANGGVPQVIQTAAGQVDTEDEDPTGGAAPSGEAAPAN